MKFACTVLLKYPPTKCFPEGRWTKEIFGPEVEAVNAIAAYGIFEDQMHFGMRDIDVMGIQVFPVETLL